MAATLTNSGTASRKHTTMERKAANLHAHTQSRGTAVVGTSNSQNVTWHQFTPCMHQPNTSSTELQRPAICWC